MIQDEINVNLRSRLQIIDMTDENKPKIILSNIIPVEKTINNNITEDNRKHND